MQKQLDPKIMVVGIVLLVAVVGFFAWRTLAPHPEPYTISPPGQDADGAAAKRANHLKAMGQTPPPNAGGTDTRQ